MPAEEPLTGTKKTLANQGFTEVDFEVSNTAVGSVVGVTFMALFCISLCTVDAPTVRKNVRIGMKNIRSRLG